MTSREIRQQFIDFFKEKEHKFIRSSSVAPIDDPTLLFTNAGMNQFKPIFLGDLISENKRAVNSQKCIRVSGKHNDLEEVGVDDYHHTFFEMLGNWSFGDYYKKEAIEWAWELLTDVWGMDKNRLWVTIFQDDDETGDLWKEYTDISDDRILKFGHKDNFWEMGDVGPCGPCTEIHYYTGDDPTNQNSSGVNVSEEYREIWNLVFIQYNRDKNGNLNDLPSKHVDTGMGLERVVSILNGKSSNYDSDLFQPIISKISEISGKSYKDDGVSHRVLADHLRMLSFSIADGAMPGNEGRGYVLRRVLRRASRFGRTLGMDDPFISRLVPTLIDIMGDSFPELKEKQSHIEKVIFSEEKSFSATLDKGLNIFDKIVSDMGVTDIISGEDVFRLYDTYGFPVDLTALMAREHGFEIDAEGFDVLMDEQRTRARESGKFKALDDKAKWVQKTEGDSNKFLGYADSSSDSVIRKYRQLDDSIYEIVLDQTPFYAEQGGQAGDKGKLDSDDFTFNVEDAFFDGEDIVHHGQIVKGHIGSVNNVVATIDENRRESIRLNHTATHLLHKALKEIIGEHVQQAGSLVESNKLRFDFTHHEKVSKDDVFKIEKMVNTVIRDNISVKTNVMDYDSAKKTGAISMFGEKYGDRVRVVEVSGFSNEFCGGTHVNRTGNIGAFKIVSESSLAAGIRRIEAITGDEIVDWMNKSDNLLQGIQKKINCSSDDIYDRIDALIKSKINLEKELAKQQFSGGNNIVDQIMEKSDEVNGRLVVIDEIEFSGNILDLGDQIRNRLKNNGISLIGIKNKNKPVVLCVISDSLLKMFHAGDIVREVGSRMKGGGGGKPHIAQAGGKDIALLSDALNYGKELIYNRVKNEKN